jgi:hypothetical protein
MEGDARLSCEALGLWPSRTKKTRGDRQFVGEGRRSRPSQHKFKIESRSVISVLYNIKPKSP